jgi:acetyl-CoA C-acetyltransferase
MLPEPAVILKVCTPIGSFGGALEGPVHPDLGAVVIREAIRRATIRGSGRRDRGCVLQAGAGMNAACQAALRQVPKEVPSETVNRVRFRLQAIIHAVSLSTDRDLVIMGIESMSNAPTFCRARSTVWGTPISWTHC